MSLWEGIEEFVAIARTGSFAAGAAEIGASRTHMSRAIARLEDRLRTRLLHRTTRSVRLTPTGQVFLEHCNRLVQERDEAIALVREQGEPQGELNITCSTALGERYVAPLARRFAVQHPRIKVFLDLSNRVTDLVNEGYDLAIRTGHLTDSRLIATKIASRQLHTCASPEYLSQRGSPEQVDDLVQHNCVVGSSTLWHFSEDEQERLFQPTCHWRCNSGGAVLAAAIEGMGICQLPHFYVKDALLRGQLIPVLERNAPPAEPIWAVYPDRRHLSPKVRGFVHLLRSELQAALEE